MLAKRGKMFRRAVTFVRAKPVHGKYGVPFFDHVVAMNFRKNGSRCNRSRKRVSMDNWTLRQLALELHRINQQVVGAGTQLRNRLLDDLATVAYRAHQSPIDVPRAVVVVGSCSASTCAHILGTPTQPSQQEGWHYIAFYGFPYRKLKRDHHLLINASL